MEEFRCECFETQLKCAILSIAIKLATFLLIFMIDKNNIIHVTW